MVELLAAGLALSASGLTGWTPKAIVSANQSEILLEVVGKYNIADKLLRYGGD